MVSLAINHHKHQWNISSTSGESFSHHQLRLTPWPHANCVPWDQLWHLHWWGTALKESIQNISEQLLQKRPRPRHITGYYGHISGATPISRSKICSSQGHWSPDWPCESIHPVFTREISNFFPTKVYPLLRCLSIRSIWTQAIGFDMFWPVLHDRYCPVSDCIGDVCYCPGVTCTYKNHTCTSGV